MLEQSYREGGWVEIVEEDEQREAFLDFAEEQEVRDRISEVLETRDEEGNFVLGDLPQVVGDTLAWPLNPTEEQLNTPIGEEMKRFIKERGEEFEKVVREAAGGGEITHKTLYEVTAAWEEEPLVTRDLERVSTEFVLGEER